MANGQRTYDPATTSTMLSTFDNAQSGCKQVQSQVDGASGHLAGSYRGDAATRYQNSIQEWQTGFNRVQNALNLLNESMGKYRQITTTTESNNQGYAGGWANAG
ncbi:WXG100 family type VII secretion target [Kineosporia babensis]|uniref:WXG100 family type VII secretion target n=1 Tax=Kineosporia babensis TaxID=499548 RepID=A0A9X1SXK1_9ACTN|nr:WXG100 family type VII secretion target [Kineosporia babensis]MCD5310303.1 WXG100 family type VII secretion target [Kineosporia babensis]